MTGWTEGWRPVAGVVVGGNLVPSQAWWEPYRWRVWVTEKRCLLLLPACCWAAVLVFSTRGEEGNFHVRLMQGPRAVWLPYMVRYFHTDTYCWDRGPRADKTWMDTRRAGSGCSHGHGYSHGRERHRHTLSHTREDSPRGMTGAATHSYSRPHRAESSRHRAGGLACSRITPACLGSLQGPTTYYGRVRRYVPVALLPSCH